MVKAKLFKKLGILLISFISIISMAKIQVKALRYVDCRFISNANVIRNIYEKAQIVFTNELSPQQLDSNIASQKPKVSFTIFSNDETASVWRILLIVPSLNSEEEVYMNLETRLEDVYVWDIIEFFCQSESDKLKNFLLDDLLRCTKVMTKKHIETPRPGPQVCWEMPEFGGLPKSVVTLTTALPFDVRFAEPNFFTRLENEKPTYDQFIEYRGNATVEAYQLVEDSDELFVVNNVACRLYNRAYRYYDQEAY